MWWCSQFLSWSVVLLCSLLLCSSFGLPCLRFAFKQFLRCSLCRIFAVICLSPRFQFAYYHTCSSFGLGLCEYTPIRSCSTLWRVRNLAVCKIYLWTVELRPGIPFFPSWLVDTKPSWATCFVLGLFFCLFFFCCPVQSCLGRCRYLLRYKMSKYWRKWHICGKWQINTHVNAVMQICPEEHEGSRISRDVSSGPNFLAISNLFCFKTIHYVVIVFQFDLLLLLSSTSPLRTFADFVSLSLKVAICHGSLPLSAV